MKRFALIGAAFAALAAASPVDAMPLGLRTALWGIAAVQHRADDVPPAPDTYTVSYNPGSHGVGLQHIDTKMKDVALVLEDAVFMRTGYTQTGWATSDGGAKAYDLGTSYTDNAAATLYPFWTVNQYSVTFDANGGTGGTSVTQDYGTAIVAPEVSREGYTFVSWTPDVDTAVPASNVTYMAQWQINANWIEIGTASKYETEADGTAMLDLGACVESLSQPKLTVKGLPTGLKYDSKMMTISGKATKPGKYTVTVSATNATVKKPVTKTFELVVPNLVSAKMPGLRPETDAYGIVLCGVVHDADLIDCAPADGWALKAAGLPAGLKLVQDKATGAYSITGVPTKAGSYTVTFTASKKGEKNQVATITLNVEALPTWAVGTFAGRVSAVSSKPPYQEYGSATMTVAANGKVSGKIALMGTNWTFKADSYSAIDCRPSDVADGVAGTNFVVNVVATAGKVKRAMELRVTSGGFIETALPGLVNARAEGESGDGEWSLSLWRNVWKDKATAAAAKAEAARWEGVYTLSMDDGGYLSLTVGRDGNVKASGKLADGTSASATSPLMYDGDEGWFAYFYAASGAYKGGAFAAAVGFDADAAVSSKPPYRLLPVMFVPQWSSRNPQATGEYGAGFVRPVSFVGAYYDKAEKLNDYYKSLRFDAEAPQLAYTFKWTYMNEKGKKVTESETLEAEAASTLGQDGLTVAINAKGTFDVAKATKPVQDKKTKEWSYYGTNDGALTLSFAQATGIFKGSYTFWYDYESAYDDTKEKSTVAHTSKKVSFEGIWVQGAESLRGFYLWDATGSYKDPKTGKPKTYKYKESHAVGLVP